MAVSGCYCGLQADYLTCTSQDLSSHSGLKATTISPR
jgi:hypothetical protein